MLTWMLYVVVITLLLSGAALAAERAARSCRARSRWIWAVTIVASLLIPTLIASVSIQVPNLLTPTVSRKVTHLRELTSVQVIPLTWVHEHTGNIVATTKENQLLQRTWIALSASLLAALVLNGLHLVRRRRRWRVGIVAGASVYIASDAGPAVVGLLRPRIVIPEWLAKASPSRQAIVIAHEESHLHARDPQLLTVALCLLVLMPWNLPLWWQLHRLRRSIEVDCDARVLKGGLDSGQYGETLIEVSQRPSAYIGSVAAMSESRSFLEERISIIVSNPAKWGAVAAVMLASLALALVAIASQVTPPNFDQRPVILTSAELDPYVGFYLRGTSVLLSITRDDERLLMRFPGEEPLEFVAESQGIFEVGGGRWTFVHDAQGQITALVFHFGNAFSYPLPRIDASTAQTIMAHNELRARSQTPTPGGEPALRRLLDGLRTHKPNYDEMAPWFADLVKATAAFNEVYARWGAVQSITFSHVDVSGGDVYDVVQEGGYSRWNIWLDSNGIIQDADNYRG
jgi:beta-lactamase regulating signal transducer with metallopeptidase domain